MTTACKTTRTTACKTSRPLISRPYLSLRAFSGDTSEATELNSLRTKSGWTSCEQSRTSCRLAAAHAPSPSSSVAGPCLCALDRELATDSPLHVSLPKRVVIVLVRSRPRGAQQPRRPTQGSHGCGTIMDLYIAVGGRDAFRCVASSGHTYYMTCALASGARGTSGPGAPPHALCSRPVAGTRHASVPPWHSS